MSPLTKQQFDRKRLILALVERGGEARAFSMPVVTAKNIREKAVTHAGRKSRLHTDESSLYPTLGTEFVTYETVNHGAKEYARGDVTTNTVEDFFGVFKRGTVRLYQHCGEQHLQRYGSNSPSGTTTAARSALKIEQRAVIACHGTTGKRLTYRRTDGAQDTAPIGTGVLAMEIGQGIAADAVASAGDPWYLH